MVCSRCEAGRGLSEISSSRSCRPVGPAHEIAPSETVKKSDRNRALEPAQDKRARSVLDSVQNRLIMLFTQGEPLFVVFNATLSLVARLGH